MSTIDMTEIETLKGTRVTIQDRDGVNRWSYKDFFIASIFSMHEGRCHHCDRSITYNYVVTHPVHGDTYVGMECVRTVLSDDAVLAASSMRNSRQVINQNRLRNRIAKIEKGYPKAMLRVLSCNMGKHTVKAGEALHHLTEKLRVSAFITQSELSFLQELEAKLK